MGNFKIMHAIIYKLTSPSGGFYVGSTTMELKHRLSVHYSYLRKGEHPNFILQAVYDKYLVLTEEVLEEFEYLEVTEVIKKEQEWLDKLKPRYNICKRAYVQEMTQEIKDKISSTLKGRKHSEDRKIAIQLGKEAAIKLAASLGKPYKQLSVKGREKIIEGAKKRVLPILAVTLEGYIEFDSVRNAAEILDISTSTIHCSIRDGKPSREGFWFLHL